MVNRTRVEGGGLEKRVGICSGRYNTPWARYIERAHRVERYNGWLGGSYTVVEMPTKVAMVGLKSDTNLYRGMALPTVTKYPPTNASF